MTVLITSKSNRSTRGRLSESIRARQQPSNLRHQRRTFIPCSHTSSSPPRAPHLANLRHQRRTFIPCSHTSSSPPRAPHLANLDEDLVVVPQLLDPDLLVLQQT